MKKIKFGLKLWSTNIQYVLPARKLFASGVYDYIELFVIPGSYCDYSAAWSELNIPFNVHAPHYMQGMNLSDPKLLKKNMVFADEAKRFADLLKAKYIVFHPGISGRAEETVRQIRKINDKRVLIENKPYYTILRDGKKCTGSKVEEIEYILKNSSVGFCFDIGHAICTANALKTNRIEYVKRFISLDPDLFHFSDGCLTGIIDRHKNIGSGTYPIRKLLNLLPEKTIMLTVETEKNHKKVLDDFVSDIKLIKRVI